MSIIYKIPDGTGTFTARQYVVKRKVKVKRDPNNDDAKPKMGKRYAIKTHSRPYIAPPPV